MARKVGDEDFETPYVVTCQRQSRLRRGGEPPVKESSSRREQALKNDFSQEDLSLVTSAATKEDIKPKRILSGRTSAATKTGRRVFPEGGGAGFPTGSRGC